MLDYMDAYNVLEGIDINIPIEEGYFNVLKNNFQKNYLTTKNYFERIAKHRNPIEVKSEVLNEIYSYLLKIQNREEMRDIDTEKNISGYVPTKIIDIWKSDKRLKSCYNSIKEYCIMRSKNFNIIAVHIAEYRAMSKLASSIERSKYKLTNSKFQNHESHSINDKEKAFVSSEKYKIDKPKKQIDSISIVDLLLMQEHRKRELIDSGIYDSIFSNKLSDLNSTYLPQEHLLEKEKNAIPETTKHIVGIKTVIERWINRNKWWLIPAFTTLIVGLIILALSIYAHLHKKL